MQLDQLVTPSEAARLKGMKLNSFLYYVKANRTPAPVVIGIFEHLFFDLREIERWEPARRRPGRRAK